MSWRAAGALAAVALFAPAAAVAHPCASANVKAAAASSFLSVNSAGWVGMHPAGRRARVRRRGRPGDVDARQGGVRGLTVADDPTLEQVAAEFEHSPNMTPIGYSRAHVPTSGTGSGAINSDLAFQGKYAYQGTYTGFRILDIENPADPKQLVNYTGCTTGAGRHRRPRQHPRALRGTPRSTPPAPPRSPAAARSSARASRASTSSTSPTRRTRRWSTSTTTAAGDQGLRLAATGTPGGPAAARTPRPPSRTPPRGYLYIYNGGSTGTCTWMDILKIKISDPTEPSTSSARRPARQCHDNTVFLNGADSRASCAGGNGISMFKFDATIDPTLPGGIENPILLWTKPMTGVGDRPLRPRSATTARPSSSAMSRAAASARSARPPARPSTVAVLPERRDRRPDRHAHAPAAADQPRELHLAQLQHRADQGRQLPRVRQLPGRHQRDRLHAAGRAEGRRLRRPEAAAQRPPTAATVSPTAATGRPTGTTARSTRPTSTAASSSGTSTTRSPTAPTRSRTRTRRRRSARSRPTTSPRRSRRPTRAPATCRAHRPGRVRVRRRGPGRRVVHALDDEPRHVDDRQRTRTRSPPSTRPATRRSRP